MNKVLISILGQDQPGIVAVVARTISACHGNIENVSQTLLQDVFAALMIVSLPADAGPESLQQALQNSCAGLDLVVHVDRYRVSPAPRVRPEVQPYVVTVIGPDRQGLVAEVATPLARHGVNITNMQAIFKGGNKPLDNLMIFEVDVPRQTVMDELRNDMQTIAGQLGLEINIQHRKIFEAVSSIDR